MSETEGGSVQTDRERVRSRLRDALLWHAGPRLDLDGVHCGCGWSAETTREQAHTDHVVDCLMVYVAPAPAPAGDSGSER